MIHNHVFITSSIKLKKQKLQKEFMYECTDTYFCLKCCKTDVYRIATREDETEIFDLSYYDCVCDEDLAVAIYSRIIEIHPNISDEQAYKYLNAALNNIRTKPKTEEVQKKRIKRLGLHPKFNRWNEKDVINN